MEVKGLFFTALVLFLLVGTFGLKDIRDCEGTALSDSERIECYHLAAMSHAYLGQKERAIVACYKIIYDVAEKHRVNGRLDDLGKRAEVEKNNCLFDVAKATRDPGVCSGIDEEDLGWAVVGAPVTREICEDQVGRLEALDPAVYQSDPNSICRIIFILPLLLVAVLLKTSFI